MTKHFDNIKRRIGHIETRLDRMDEREEHMYDEIRAMEVAMDVLTPSRPPIS